MSLTKLEQLAKDASSAQDCCGDNEKAIVEFHYSTNPETILKMCELMREMGEALECYEDSQGQPQYVKDALSKYKEWVK